MRVEYVSTLRVRVVLPLLRVPKTERWVARSLTVGSRGSQSSGLRGLASASIVRQEVNGHAVQPHQF